MATVLGCSDRLTGLAEQLPEAVAFAAYGVVVGPLLDNPHRVDAIVLSLTARGLTTGDIAAHFADV